VLDGKCPSPIAAHQASALYAIAHALRFAPIRANVQNKQFCLIFIASAADCTAAPSGGTVRAFARPGFGGRLTGESA
jgi:hypothetical protein